MAARQWRARSIPSTAACAARRNFRSARCFELLWRAGMRTQRRTRFFEPRRAHARATSARAASTIISAAAFRATRSTSAGSCRISRRCSTTTPSFSSCWPWRMRAPAIRCSAARSRETVGWLEREMTTEGGRFCRLARRRCEGEEGKFYVWSQTRLSKRWAPKMPHSSRALRRDRRGKFRGPQYPQPAQRLYRAAWIDARRTETRGCLVAR